MQKWTHKEKVLYADLYESFVTEIILTDNDNISYWLLTEKFLEEH